MTAHRLHMTTAALVWLCWVMAAGCSTALEREGRCLASLSPDFLSAYEEIQSLEHEWRAEVRSRQEEWFNNMTASRRSTPASLGSASPAHELYEGRPTEREERAYAKLVEAKARHRDAIEWYGRVYDRFRTRVEEDQLLSQTRAVLLTNPAIIFYPIVRWNIRMVLWDGIDPDAGTDAVTLYCRTRLAALSQVPADGSVALDR